MNLLPQLRALLISVRGPQESSSPDFRYKKNQFSSLLVNPEEFSALLYNFARG